MAAIFRRRHKDPACISFPKSGRTWVRFALHTAGVKVRFSHGGSGTKNPDEIGSEFSSVKPHLFGDRNVFLHRNPLDTAVSLFHQIHKRNFTPINEEYPRIQEKLINLDRLPPEDIDEFVLHPVWGCRNICAYNAAHIRYFTGRRDSMIAKYERLRADPRVRFAELLDFLGHRRYDIDHVVAESSFKRMREIEMSSDAATKRSHKLFGAADGDANTLKVRKGKVRGYADCLRPETIAAAAEIAADFGFDI